MNEPTRVLLFSVVDRAGSPVSGALVRFYVNNRVRTEGMSGPDPLRFEISTKVNIVDVEIFYAPVHQWVKVPMNSGKYDFAIDVPPARSTAPQPAPPPSVPPNPPPTDVGKPWLSPGVWAAVIAAISAIIGAYWQFVYKPKHELKTVDKRATVRIVVKDAKTHTGLQYAHVQISDGASLQDDTTDVLGSTKATAIPVSGGSTIQVTADAQGHDRASRNIDRPTSDQTYTIELPPTEVTRPTATARPIRLNGTWDIEAAADPNNARVSNGTFTFTPQGNGSVLVSAHFVADGTHVTLSGACGVQDRQVRMSFHATTEQGGSWDGSANLTMESATRITGRIQSKRGDDVGIVLKK